MNSCRGSLRRSTASPIRLMHQAVPLRVDCSWLGARPDKNEHHRRRCLPVSRGEWPVAVQFMNNLLVGIGCIGMLILPASQTRWTLPATIETLRDVPAQRVEGAHQ